MEDQREWVSVLNEGKRGYTLCLHTDSYNLLIHAPSDLLNQILLSHSVQFIHDDTFEFDSSETLRQSSQGRFQPVLKVVGEPPHLLCNTTWEGEDEE